MLSLAMSPEGPPPRISLVIPAYNEERYLPRLLDTVEAAARRHPRGPAAVEVIVADNASTDRTAEIARARGCRVVPVAKRCIAAARNAGGFAARGEIVAFVDADMRIHGGTFNAIEQALASDRIVGGATGLTLERWSFGLVVTFVAILPVVWLTRFDSGLVFCRRSDFLATGGYNESFRLAEDVAFLYALRRVGRRKRMRLTRLTQVKAVASTRKFDEHGDWHYLTTLPRLMLGMLFRQRGAVSEIERYWYEPNR
jgi:glycosyltransferase involved in cell wall biosynthesis